jgi:hypothetical protein
LISVDSVLDRILEEGIARAEDLIGCNPDQIEALRRDQGVARLPDSYARFLSRAGRSAGPVLRGTDAFFPSLIGIKSDARSLLRDARLLDDQFDSESVVVAMHQGYQVFWLVSVNIPDPPVRMYQEGDANVSATWDSFAHFLDGAVDERAYR